MSHFHLEMEGLDDATGFMHHDDDEQLEESGDIIGRRSLSEFSIYLFHSHPPTYKLYKQGGIF